MSNIGSQGEWGCQGVSELGGVMGDGWGRGGKRYGLMDIEIIWEVLRELTPPGLKVSREDGYFD